MNKMKRNLVFKILNSNITSYEFDLIIFLTTIQEEDGTVASIYYKNIKDNLKCSVATVYNIINGLEKKGFVKKEKNSPHGEDFNIRILDNDFSKDIFPVKNDNNGEIIDWKKKYTDYIDTDFVFLYNSEFRKLPLGAKKLALYYLNRYVSSGKEKTDRFWYSSKHYLNKKFCMHIGVKSRSLKKYYNLLNEYIDVAYSLQRKLNERCKEAKYDIVVLKEKFKERITTTFSEKGKNVTKRVYPTFFADCYKVMTVCRKNRIAYNEQELIDTASLMYQYVKIFDNYKKIKKERTVEAILSLWEILKECILKVSLLELQPKAVHKELITHLKYMYT